jgi:murein DD-endopeptidase MepM/ murein hydrolase activator NlpD
LRRSSSGFIWPASGPISSYYGPRHPLGIDIDFFNDPSQPIVAAATGIVTFAGGDACCSYGLYVIVDHGNGFTTLYAHMSRIAVRVGQPVAQGTLLGYGGSTGYATGNHLHFEIHKDGAVLNPLTYLP